MLHLPIGTCTSQPLPKKLLFALDHDRESLLPKIQRTSDHGVPSPMGCPTPVDRLTRRLLYSGSENILDEKQKDGKSWRARNSPVRLCPRNDREVSLVMPGQRGGLNKT